MREDIDIAGASKTEGAGVRLLAPEQAPATKTQAAGGSGAISAVYRATAADAWQDCEIIGYQANGMVLREVGRRLNGVFLASLDQVRIPVGVIEQPEIVTRDLPPMTPTQYYKYRHIREVAGRDEALRLVVGSP